MSDIYILFRKTENADKYVFLTSETKEYVARSALYLSAELVREDPERCRGLLLVKVIGEVDEEGRVAFRDDDLNRRV